MRNISIHMTNINGIGVGATRLLESLIPAFLCKYRSRVNKIYAHRYFSSLSQLCDDAGVVLVYYQRYLPNAISRFLECTLFSHKFRSNDILIVMGDLPIRGVNRQILFVQNPNLCRNVLHVSMEEFKFFFMRMIFSFNAGCVSVFVVQTDYMKKSLSKYYGIRSSNIKIISQPVPTWVRDVKEKTSLPVPHELNLFYPSNNYPHKGHWLLENLSKKYTHLPVNKLVLTVRDGDFNFSSIDWIQCVGVVGVDKMKELYQQSDALLFLSEQESYGFPLIEAMYLGLPVICPRLPYATTICGEQAIYFDSSSPESLSHAILLLSKRISIGWMPDWSSRLMKLNSSWTEVSAQFVEACDSINTIK